MIINSTTKIVKLCYEYKFIALFFLITAFFISTSKITELKVDVSNQSYLTNDDPVKINYYLFRDLFGTDDIAIVYIKNTDIYNTEFLEKVKELQSNLNALELVDEVESIVNARYTYGEDDELIIEELMENWGKSISNLSDLKRKVESVEAYKNQLYSTKENGIVLSVKFERYIGSGDDKRHINDEDLKNSISELLQVVNDVNLDINLSGGPITTFIMGKVLEESMTKLTSLSFIVISILLLLIFRRITAVIIPMLVVMIALISTYGIMALLDINVMATSQILPSLIIAFGICDTVHMLTVFYTHLNQGEAKKIALIKATKSTSFALIMTTITTAAGLASFTTSSMPPVEMLGLFGAIGVCLALILTLTLTPIIISILPIKEKSKADKANKLIEYITLLAAKSSLKYPKLILISTLAIVIVSVFNITKLELSHDPLNWFSEEHQLRKEISVVDSAIDGHLAVDIIFNTNKARGITDPDFLNKLEEAISIAYKTTYKKVEVSKTSSVIDIVKETNKALFSNDPQQYIIPESQNMIAQELLIFESGSPEDLYSFTDPEFKETKLTLYTKFEDLRDVYLFSEKLVKEYEKLFGSGVLITTTGTVHLAGSAFNSILDTLISSYSLALVLISLSIFIMLRSIKLGMLALIPNFVPIIITLGVMPLFSIPLDVFTILIASIMLGVIVDDTIHYMHCLKEQLKRENISVSIKNTNQIIGKQLIFTSLIISSAFLVYIFADFKNVMAFGILTSVTCLTALISDLFILPAALIFFSKTKGEVNE